MSHRQVIDVTELINEQKIGSFLVMLVLLSMLVALSEGFDVQAAALAAPGLVQAWHIERAGLGPVFSAGPMGMLAGAVSFAYLADRFGRRKAIIGATVLYGGVTFIAAFASSLNELLVLRFATGLGLGGLVPTLTAVVAEYAPQRMRATMIVLMHTGITLGAMSPALVTAILGHNYTWQAVFVIGGIAPLVMATFLYFLLPESIKFLVVQKEKSHAGIARLIARIRPGLEVAPDAQFVIAESAKAEPRRVPVGRLFSDGLAMITLLVWVVQICQLVTSYFLHSWMPIMFRDDGLSIREMGIATAMYDVGGLLGALLVSRVLDKRGLIALVVFYFLACPLIASVGVSGPSVIVVCTAVFLAGFCIVGVSGGVTAAVASIYPTAFRANGIGWASAVGRCGAMAGPLIGAWLIGMHASVQQLFMAPIVPLGTAGLASLALMHLCRARFKGHRLGDAASLSPVAATEGGMPVLEAREL